MTITTPRAASRWHIALHLGLASALVGGALGLATPTAQAEEATTTISNGTISWGVKASFRSYLTGPIAGGSITATDPATDDGTQTTFANANGTWGTATARVATEGSVNFSGHDGALNFTISEPRIVISDSKAQLVVDAVSSDSTVLDDLALADLDLSEAVTTSATAITITDAPATLTEAGGQLFAYQGNAFYSAGQTLDSVDAQFTIAPAHTAAAIQVSQTSIREDQSATVTITGTGFEPSESTATRPPLAGKPSGLYVVVGKFADIWKPSAGAKSSARKALSSQTKWAVLADDMNTIGGSAAGAIELTDAGTFTTTMTFSKAELDTISGLTEDHTQYGIYTYPGGGATNTEWELVQPLTFTAAPPAATTTSVRVSATSYGRPAVATVTVFPSSATGTVTLTAAARKYTRTLSGGKASFALPATLMPGSYPLTASYSGAPIHTTSTGTARLKVSKAQAVVKTKIRKKPTRRNRGKITITLVGPSKAVQPTGTVKLRFTKGKKSYYVKRTVKGSKTFTMRKLTRGTWKVSVRYSGNSRYSVRGYRTVAKVRVK